MNKLKRAVSEYLYDSSKDLRDRAFVLFLFCMIVALLANVVCGVVAGESLSSTLATLGGGVFFSVYCILEVKKGKIKRARIVSSIVLIVVFMPVMFFMKGGIYLGAPIALLLDSFFIVVILDGKIRVILSIINVVILGTCVLVSYIWPELVTVNDHIWTWYFYTFSQMIIANLVLSFIFVFQTKLYRKETEISEENARELEEMNRSQNRFFSSMSHEIRTPINTVLGLNEIILRQEDASEEIRKDAANIRGAGKMLLALINDILDVSKIEAGKMDIVPVEYKVSSMMSEIVNMIWLKAEEKGLKFNVDIDPGVPDLLFGDEVRIKQILINLLNNAVKYTQEGSVNLHLECDIEDGETAMLSITVSDTGMGIKQEALPHLFDSFQRVDEEKNRHIEGTGLGLSIVKQLVELMDGEINVSSIYTQGSTFSVRLRQKVVSEETIGDLQISNMGGAGTATRFEHSFHAPGARILIVDDNDMNLQVEKKLLDGTELQIDLAISGEKALSLTLKKRYDVVFMDHLMPEMDGIECYKRIRNQKGGLNHQVPIIVLTANAGGENIELYNSTGFDGYLVKPVSGDQLENMLLSHLPANKVQRIGSMEMASAQMNTGSRYVRKRPLVVTTNSMIDVPKSVLREQGIDTLPFYITTDEGEFADGVEIDSDEMAHYMMDESHKVNSYPSSKDEYVKFFSKQLKSAHHLLHIALSPNASVEWSYLEDVIKSFENVTIYDSGTFTSAAGILTLIANRMASQNVPVGRIIQELDEIKDRLNCGFVITNTDYLTRRGLIPPFINKIFKMLWMRPVLRVKDGKLGIGGVIFGNIEKTFKKYIKKTLSSKAHPDLDIVFITYTGLPEERLLWIEEEVKKRYAFNRVVVQKASAGITSNCGPGTFGIIFMEKGDKSYGLSTLFERMEESGEETVQAEEEDEREEEVSDKDILSEAMSNYEKLAQEHGIRSGDEASGAVDAVVAEPVVSDKWYDNVPAIDVEQAVRNSGSVDAFLMVLGMYHESAKDRDTELTGFYESEDWENYTIKVHSLKSSSRLAGAMHIGKEAEKLEMAGKNGDIDYIREHHGPMMEEFRELEKILDENLGDEEESDPVGEAGSAQPDDEDREDTTSAADPADDRPMADDFLMESVYEMLREGAEGEDADLIADSFAEIDAYRIPEEDSGLMERLRESYEGNDFDGIITLLDEAGK